MGGTRSRKRSSSSSSSPAAAAAAAKSGNRIKKAKKMWKSKKKPTEAHAETMFQELVEGTEGSEDYDTEQLTMEGIAILGEKLGLDVESDLRILVLLWKCDVKKPGTLTKHEWLTACKDGVLHVQNSWESLREQLPALDIGFLTGNEFKDFYKFCFQFNRQGTHRTLDKDLVVALLQLVLKERVAADRLASFCEFLASVDGTPKEQQYSRITLDQWTSFWDFCVDCEDLSTYDESTSAWPVLIDEYVEFMEEKMKK